MGKFYIIVCGIILLGGCVGNKPHDDLPGVIFSQQEWYKNNGYIYHKSEVIIIKPAYLEWVGTNSNNE